MSGRVFVEIEHQSYLQSKGDPRGLPDNALWCADAGCWIRESVEGLLIEDGLHAAADRLAKRLAPYMRPAEAAALALPLMRAAAREA
jgi:hypothetical protein